MIKKTLSEISLYQGEVKMPKFFEINREELKADILSSHLSNKSISKNNLEYAVLDYEIPFSKAFDMLHKYICEHFYLNYKINLILHKSFGNILDIKQQSFSRKLIDPSNLKNSPDYVMIYGVDVQPDAASIVIEYDDNRRVNNLFHSEIKNNNFIIFPSNQRYFITNNNSDNFNVLLTTTFGYI